MLAFSLPLAPLFFGFSFTVDSANTIYFCLVYMAYCFFVAACSLIRKKYLRIIVLIVTAMPILYGYALGTVGAIGLMFMIPEGPSVPEEVSVGMTCRMTGWGMAASASGYRVSLYNVWKWGPFLQQEVFSLNCVETEGDPAISCADALAAYRKTLNPAS